MGLKDSKYNSDIILNYGSRFGRKAITFEQSDDTYLQLWEHRRYFEIYLQKRFPIEWDLLSLEVFVGLGNQFIWGKYDGTRKKISPSYSLVPQAGIQLNFNPIYFGLGYEYTNYQIYEVSPHKMKITFGIHFNFIEKPETYRLLWL